MVVNQPYEVYTLAIAFFLNNRIWDLMVMTGIAYIPVITMIVSSVVDAYTGGDDEGDRGSVALRHIEMGIVRIFCVMIFVLIPNGDPFSTNSVAYEENSCARDSFVGSLANSDKTTLYSTTGNLFYQNELDVAADGTTTHGTTNISNGYLMNISDSSPRPPYLLEFVHNLSSQSVNAIIKTMPCETDFTGVSIAMGELAFKTEDSQGYLSTFVKQCYAPALREQVKAADVDASEIDDDYWVGSTILYNGDYETRKMNLDPNYWANLQQDFIAATPLYTYNYAADMNTKDNGRASPTCKNGYNAVKLFVERDFKNQIDDLNDVYHDHGWTTLSKLAPKWFSSNPSNTERGIDSIIMRLTSADPEDQLHANAFKTKNALAQNELNNSTSYYAITTIADAATSIALGKGYLDTLIEGTVQRSLALPLAAIMQCFLIVVAPILLLISGYSIKSVVMIVVTMFGFECLHLIFELCAWMENTLIALTASSYSAMSIENQKTKLAVYNAVNVAYILLPIIWFNLLSTVSGALSHVGQAMAGGGAGASGFAKKTLEKGGKEGAKAAWAGAKKVRKDFG